MENDKLNKKTTEKKILNRHCKGKEPQNKIAHIFCLQKGQKVILPNTFLPKNKKYCNIDAIFKKKVWIYDDENDYVFSTKFGDITLMDVEFGPFRLIKIVTS